jgi:hypothetical protein
VPFVLLESSDDRAAAGRRIIATLLAGVVIVCGVAVSKLGHDGASAKDAPVPAPVSFDASRQVIAVGQGIRHNRCDVRGFANDVALTYEIDTGDPNIADFPSSYVRKLGIGESLNYTEWWPGTRYGKIATTTLRQIRIGDVVWNDSEVNVHSDWAYSFGSDEIPLLGLAALRMRGINVEFEGDRCQLTVARKNRRAGS